MRIILIAISLIFVSGCVYNDKYSKKLLDYELVKTIKKNSSTISDVQKIFGKGAMQIDRGQQYISYSYFSTYIGLFTNYATLIIYYNPETEIITDISYSKK